MKIFSVCVIIPAYNESSVIGELIGYLGKTFDNTKYKLTMVVVDDGSSDNTAHESEKAGAYVIKHIINTGSGGATATGLSFAKRSDFDVAATFDADGQHDPKDLLEGIRIMLNSNDDLLIGSRLIDTTGMSNAKILGNKGLSFITQILFGTHVTDSQSGLRIFSKHALNNLEWKSNGYEFCSEMLWRAKQAKLNISEFPIKAIYTDY